MKKDWDYYLSINDIAPAVKDLIENKTVKALIDESKKIIYSPKTISQPALTGRVAKMLTFLPTYKVLTKKGIYNYGLRGAFKTASALASTWCSFHAK
jgi:hypothetical protein